MTAERWVTLSWWMLGLSALGMAVNDALYIKQLIDDSANLFVTLNLSYLALIIGATSTIVAAQANRKLHEDEE